MQRSTRYEIDMSCATSCSTSSIDESSLLSSVRRRSTPSLLDGTRTARKVSGCCRKLPWNRIEAELHALLELFDGLDFLGDQREAAGT